jgi:hypothetical protein
LFYGERRRTLTSAAAIGAFIGGISQPSLAIACRDLVDLPVTRLDAAHDGEQRLGRAGRASRFVD